MCLLLQMITTLLAHKCSSPHETEAAMRQWAKGMQRNNQHSQPTSATSQPHTCSEAVCVRIRWIWSSYQGFSRHCGIYFNKPPSQSSQSCSSCCTAPCKAPNKLTLALCASSGISNSARKYKQQSQMKIRARTQSWSTSLKKVAQL